MQADNAILQRELQRMRLEIAQIGQATGVSISAEAPELQNLSSTRSREVSSHVCVPSFIPSSSHAVMSHHIPLRCSSSPRLCSVHQTQVATADHKLHAPNNHKPQ